MTLNVEDVFSGDGRIAQRLTQFEPRPQQLDMAHAVSKAIESRQHLVVEAGTGVGKSFAYLVPAILAAIDNHAEDRRRVVISTQTISLQEQLIERDLPFLNAVLPVEFSAVLVKGRSNYLSLRRLAGANEKAAALFSDPDQLADLSKISRWVEQTGDGSRTDLNFKVATNVWDEVQSEHGNCLGRRCATYQDCFYYRARRRVRNADILVVNHALFFSDLALRREGASILPDYDVAVFDEAHTLENIAADHLGFGVSSGQLKYFLNRLFNERKRRGLLLHHHAPQALETVQKLKQEELRFFADVRIWHQEQRRGNGRVRQPLSIADRCSPLLQQLGQELAGVADTLQEDQAIELTAASAKSLALGISLRQWITQSAEEVVYWIEMTGRQQQNVKLLAAPIDIGPVLAEELFEAVPTVILTSATLAVGQASTTADSQRSGPADDLASEHARDWETSSEEMAESSANRRRSPAFSYIRKRLGLTSGADLRLGSPFNYQQQARLVLVTGLPCPSETPAEFDRQLPYAVKHYVAQTNGRAFVLFTNYRQLRRTADELRDWFVDAGLTLFSQDDGLPRSLMVERFREESRAVLFGTESFWQGIDVPGDALQNVIIPKLPFSVPDHPLLQARLERIREQGGNPFMEYQVPEAIIKLKQGFGRLIRSRRDTGQVVLLDPRVKTRRYGRLFIESLPPCDTRVERYRPQLS